MATVTFEEAKRCPKCDQPGDEQTNEARRNTTNGNMIHVIRCQNERCSWFDTDWVVEVQSDGTVPVREGRQQKSFPAYPGMTTERAEAEVIAIKDNERRRGR